MGMTTLYEQDLVVQTAPVIITSCLGAYQLSMRQQQQQDTHANKKKNVTLCISSLRFT